MASIYKSKIELLEELQSIQQLLDEQPSVAPLNLSSQRSVTASANTTSNNQQNQHSLEQTEFLWEAATEPSPQPIKDSQYLQDLAEAKYQVDQLLLRLINQPATDLPSFSNKNPFRHQANQVAARTSQTELNKLIEDVTNQLLPKLETELREYLKGLDANQLNALRTEN